MMRATVSGLSLVLAMGMAFSGVSYAQKAGPSVSQQRLAQLQQTLKDKAVADKAAARAWASQHAIPLRKSLPNGRTLELQRLGPNGPVFYITHNVDAADSISTDELWPGGSSGLELRGEGLTLGEWDSGRVLLEHPDFYDKLDQPRAVQVDENADPAPVHSDHATHVAGTLIGSGGGNYPQAQGMAPGALLQAWDWNDDLQEMASAAVSGLLVSNHSYSIAAGWIAYGQAEPNNWWWIGGGGDEDPNFGRYDDEAQALDQIASNAPHYLIVKAAGNDRWDLGPEPGEVYTIVDQEGVSQGTSSDERPADCSQSGYDCLPGATVAKNILTIGAVNDVNGGYLPLEGPSSVQMTGFSSFGPTDDGRIKPDLVANGWLLFSTWGAPNYYAAIAGTSMAAPSVSGSLLLLQEHYRNLDPGNQFMRAATLKALAIHSADETGAAEGPDYEYGWGLLNTRKAAQIISANGDSEHRIVEATRGDGGPADTVNFSVSEEGARVRVTLAWTDPAGTPVSPPQLNASNSMLVNDLDLRVVGNSFTYQPWVLDPIYPDLPAARGDNTRDNVEQVDFTAAAGNYTVEVSNKLGLQGGSQNYSLVISVRPPAPVSQGLVVDESFDGGVLPEGWSVETSSGLPWSFFLDGSGDFANQTFGSGGYAMLYNNFEHATLSYLILPPLDLSSSESVDINFTSYYSLGGELESISVYTSADGGASWSHADSLSNTYHFAIFHAVDLSNKIAGVADARIAFRFDSGYLGISGGNWQVDDVSVEVYGGAPPGPPPPPLSLPGQADVPSPETATTGIQLSPTLTWNAGTLADSHKVYLGTNLSFGNDDFKGGGFDTEYVPGELLPETTYYWRVDSVNTSGTTAGVVWNFTTEPGEDPPPPTGPSTMHVADMDMSSEPLARNRWQANVRVQVRDDEGSPVASASVSGQWGNGANGSDTQATDTQGWANFSKNNLKAGVSSVTFTVTGASHTSLSYTPADNTDPDGDSDGSVITVLKDAPPPPANTSPQVTISSPVDQAIYSDGTGISLAATASDAEDDDASLVVTWRVNNQVVGTGNAISHDFPDGIHDISASVTDSGGATGSANVSITVGDPPAVGTDVLVAFMEDRSSGGDRRWTAVARITIEDDLGNKVSGATVSGDWSAGAKGGGSCVTNAAGQCEVSKGNKTSVSSVIFTVTDVAATGLSYDSSEQPFVELSPL